MLQIDFLIARWGAPRGDHKN